MSDFLPDDFGQTESDYLKKTVSLPGKLDEKERAQWSRFNASVSDLTPEFKAWLTNYILVEVSAQLPQLGGGGGSGRAMTGDYKISALAATHADPGGGVWYLCDGTAIPATAPDLIAAIGTTLPDAQGRVLAMKGTHTDVNAVGKNDGVALANRRPKHNTTVSTQPTITINDPGHGHGFPAFQAVGTGYMSGSTGFTGGDRNDVVHNGGVGGNTTGITAAASAGAYGPGGTAATDQPAFIVPGNLFIHS